MLIPAALDPHRRPLRIALISATLILWIIGLFQFYQFIHLVEFYFGAGITGDAGFYFGMGRGLLNGLHMYGDLFETKPPMIFWLSELSLLLTSGDTLYRAIQVVGLASIPIALAYVVLYLSRSHDRWIGWLMAAASFLFGAALASFTVSRSLGYQTEGFGVVPASLALLVFVARPLGARLTSSRIAVMAVCISLAVLFKEPFALSIAAGVLVLISSRTDAVDAFKAVGVAAVLWLSVLVLTGTAHSYFSLYLPEILSGRIAENVLYHDYASNNIFAIHAPLWIRGLNIVRLFSDIWSPEYTSFPAFPFLTLALAAIFLAHGASVPSGSRRWLWIFAGSLAVAFFVLFTNLAFALEQIVSYLHFRLPLNDAFFQGKSWLLLFYLLGCIAPFALLLRYSIMSAYRVATTCFALYLAAVAVAAGGDFVPHHFLFAVPLYIAAFAALVRSANVEHVRWWSVGIVGVIACLLVMNSLAVSHAFNAVQFNAAKQRDQALAASNVSRAQRLDALLAACHIPRYFVADDTGLVPGLTVHSPYQLAYGLQRAESQRDLYFASGAANSFFYAKLVRDFNATPIIVMGSPDFPYADLREPFTTRFSPLPPSCARPYLPIAGLYIFFRK